MFLLNRYRLSHYRLSHAEIERCLITNKTARLFSSSGLEMLFKSFLSFKYSS